MPEAESTTVISRDEYREQVKAWLAANATPRQPAGLWATNVVTDEHEAAARFARGRAWQRKLFDAGYAAIGWPAEYGGQGGEAWMSRIFDEESAGYEENAGFIRSTIAMLGPTLLRHGTEEQKLTYLPRLISGDYAFCQLFSEPGAGSDLAGLATAAVRDGDEFVLNGQKVWNSSAQHANWGFILTRTDPNVIKHAGITFFLIDMATPGITVRPLVQINGAVEFNEVFFDDVRVPADQMVGGLNDGWKPARTVLGNESAFIGKSGGPSTADKLIELARSTNQLDNRMIRQTLADIWARERIQKLLGQSIQTAVRRGQAPPIDGSLIKLYANETRVRSGNVAMKILGPASLLGDVDKEHWAQTELIGRFWTSIGGGTNEVQRSNLAERALGLPRDIRVDRDVAWKDVRRS